MPAWPSSRETQEECQDCANLDMETLGWTIEMTQDGAVWRSKLAVAMPYRRASGIDDDDDDDDNVMVCLTLIDSD